MSIAEQNMRKLGIELPQQNQPAANYLPYYISGNLLFIAGQTAKFNGVLQYAGKVGEKYSLEDAQKAARLCGLNILLQVKNACMGDFEKIKHCIKLNIYVNSTDDFSDHALVANGVSDLMIEVFGEKGRHTRTTVSSNSLPSHSTVEVDAIFELFE